LRMFPARHAIVVIEIPGAEPGRTRRRHTPVGALRDRRRAGFYLQKVTPVHFPFRRSQKRSRSGSLALVSDEGTRVTGLSTESRDQPPWSRASGESTERRAPETKSQTPTIRSKSILKFWNAENKELDVTNTRRCI